jgi:hypothetical protein
MAQALKIDAFNLFFRHIEPCQQFACFVSEVPALHKTGRESTVEAMP